MPELAYSFAELPVLTPEPGAPWSTQVERPIVEVRLGTGGGFTKAFALLDTGSLRSYATENVAADLDIALNGDPIEVGLGGSQRLARFAWVDCELTDGVARLDFELWLGFVTGDFARDWEVILGTGAPGQGGGAVFSIADICFDLYSNEVRISVPT